jgi:hypothetical protein
VDFGCCQDETPHLVVLVIHRDDKLTPGQWTNHKCRQVRIQNDYLQFANVLGAARTPPAIECLITSAVGEEPGQ